MAKALLVINMQEDYLGENRNKRMFSYDDKQLIKNVNNRIMQYEPQYVLYARDVKKRNIINKLFSRYVLEGTEGSNLVKGLKIVSDHIFDKYKRNAFTNLEMYKYIEDHNITELELVGLDSGSCLGETALGAVDIGYKVEICLRSTGTVMQSRADLMKSGLQGSGVKFI